MMRCSACCGCCTTTTRNRMAPPLDLPVCFTSSLYLQLILFGLLPRKMPAHPRKKTRQPRTERRRTRALWCGYGASAEVRYESSTIENNERNTNANHGILIRPELISWDGSL